MENTAVLTYSQKQVLEKTRHAAKIADFLVDEILDMLVPGMTETQARTEAKRIIEANGIAQNWHKPYVNFGKNTILTFLDKPQEEQVLQEEDIAFVDIGPIVNGVEGDAGKTIVFGNNPLLWELKHQSECIFELGRQYWLENNCTGVELYKYIQDLTKAAGFVFHLNPAGHLIGSFPHKGWKEGLHTYSFPVEEGLWILEIQIRHPELSYGAFYEAVLV